MNVLGTKRAAQTRFTDFPALPAGGGRRTGAEGDNGLELFNMLQRETKEQVYYVSAER